MWSKLKQIKMLSYMHDILYIRMIKDKNKIICNLTTSFVVIMINLVIEQSLPNSNSNLIDLCSYVHQAKNNNSYI